MMVDRDFRTRDRLGEGTQVLTLMAAVARAGKSTVARYLAQEPDTVIVRGDDVRRAMGVQFELLLEPAVRMISAMMPITLLTTGYNVIVDETNLRQRGRKEIITLARTAVPDLHVRVVQVDHPIDEEWRERCRRDGFPFEVIERMRADFEPPSQGVIEGYDEYRHFTQDQVRELWRTEA